MLRPDTLLTIVGGKVILAVRGKAAKEEGKEAQAARNFLRGTA